MISLYLSQTHQSGRTGKPDSVSPATQEAEGEGPRVQGLSGEAEGGCGSVVSPRPAHTHVNSYRHGCSGVRHT